MRLITLAFFLAVLPLGCMRGRDESVSFSVPLGDVENGELQLKEFSCYQCHTLEGTEYFGDEWRLT